MTGTPACLAFAIDGSTALVSCASTMRTFAPCEIIVSISVACCSLLRLASLSMSLPPWASTGAWIFGLSCAAQRGCWKLFHDTPTVHPAAAEPPAAADGAVELPPPEVAAGLPPLLLQAAAMIATVPTSSPSRRYILS